MKQFNFSGLFILDLANNHQGDVEHGINIIRAMGAALKEQGVRGGIKFQFRQLDSFIHPEYQGKKDIPHVQRFLSTRLEKNDYQRLISVVREEGLVPICTPFDEESVDLIEELDIDVIKVASCSASDTPLLERVAMARMPTVASTGGLDTEQIDRMVDIFSRENLNFALHHCVSIYPTPLSNLQLNQIDNLKSRYDPVPIGWSTHEDPDDTTTVQLAYSKGASFFERHVGVETEKYSLNRYSSNPAQIKKWIQGYHRAVESCGSPERPPATLVEREALRSLMRGVYARQSIKQGGKISRSDVFFAMPAVESNLLSGNWQSGLVADRDYQINDPISVPGSAHELTEEELVRSILLQIKGMLRHARISCGDTKKIELSHHYGLKRFREFGVAIIDIINRSYCKKLLIQLPRQKHPYHYHKKKEETFHVLQGSFEVTSDGFKESLTTGDTYLVEPGKWHKFATLNGVIFEEISTTHYNDDSFYQDPYIAGLPREERKTVISGWQ
jgi:sialic acid synthase SpsE/mannose-6-phosphate isomerase-like protein (cupin superfamily)